MAITLRQESDARATTKGSSLTFQELDTNFIELLDRVDPANSIVAGDNITITQPDSTGAVTISAAVLDTQIVGGTDITVSQPDSAGAFTVSYSGSAGIANVVEDTTPQLGGELDGQGNTVSDVNFKQYTETVHALGSTDTPTIDLANGNVQTVTISSGLTLPTIDNMPVGGTVTLVVSGSGTASGGADSAGQTYKFAGGNTTLTTLSIISIFYDGTDYLASIATDFQ
jgi:hypothetical protein